MSNAVAEVAQLTKLLLARHSLVCRAVELECETEILARIQSLTGVPSTDVDKAAAIKASTLAAAELSLLPMRRGALDKRIDFSIKRLQLLVPHKRAVQRQFQGSPRR